MDGGSRFTLENDPFLQRDVLRVSYSSLSAYRGCARKGMEFPKLYNWPKRSESLPGAAGNAMHRGVQEFLITRNIDKAVWALMQAYPIHLNQDAMKAWSLESCSYALEQTLNSQDLSRYQLVEITCLDGEKRHAIEVPFEIWIKNFSLSSKKQITAVVCGYIDALVYDTQTAEFNILEIKNHNQSVRDITPRYMHDDQCLPYGFILESMLKVAIQQMFIKYLIIRVDIANHYSQIMPVIKTRDNIQDWARGLAMDLYQIKMGIDSHWFRRNGSHCLAFNSKCGYLDLCNLRDPVQIQGLILGAEQPVIDPFPAPWIKLELDLAA